MRRLRLLSTGHCATEIGRIYRDALNGKLSWADAYLASGILTRLRQALEANDFEFRLRELEELYGHEAKARANGRGRNGAYPHARS